MREFNDFENNLGDGVYDLFYTKPMGKITIDRLAKAYKNDKESMDSIEEDFTSNKGGKYSFKGLIGKVTPVSKTSDLYKFNIYYTSSIDGKKSPELVFRTLKCLVDEETYNVFNEVCYDYDGKLMGYNEVIVTGKFTRRQQLIFNVKSMFPDTTINNCFRYEKGCGPTTFHYNRIGNIARYLKDVVDGEVDVSMHAIKYGVESRIFNAADGFTAYLKELKECIFDCATKTYLRYDSSYIDDVVDDITTSYDILRRNMPKLRLILDDIIMMHTGLQTSTFDQLHVLYDTECLTVMGKIMFVIQSLTRLNNSVLTMREAVIIMLVYVKGFYSKYINVNDLNVDNKRAFSIYNTTTNNMLNDFYFDIDKVTYVYNQMEKFVTIMVNNHIVL